MWFKKDVELLKAFELKYRVRISSNKEVFDSSEFEARVKAKDLYEAEKKLTEEVLKQAKMSVIITFPIKESI